MKKYELTEIRNEMGLHRIRALRDIPRYNVKKGDLGGFVEHENNLSHDGDCWVFESACISENAMISGDTWISGGIWISGDTWISGGIWMIRPILIIGSEHHVFPITPSTIKIGCEEYSITHWLENYKEIGKKNNYTDLQIEEYGSYIRVVSDWVTSMKVAGLVKDGE